ncbi:MAG: hypothetical protein CL840_06910 [Crocinitomicaceae bacterium]|nr:hypothetical protein [Crocinitomicaceae bacterium]|tara:strand:- start:5459 stop:7411 length:1953 start_codon:yes stop_codon:yes gene_type:complete
MKNLIHLVTGVLLLSYSLKAQQSISGTINNYTQVAKINRGTQSVEVSDASAFTTGDLALIIQMKGAKIDESLSTSFGTIQSYNGAGNYEMHRICRISGKELFFQNPLLNEYEATGSVQVIRVPEYDNGAILNGDLTGKPWDGNSGGVLVLKTRGTLNLDTYNVIMTGNGYRGGDALLSGGGCLFVNLNTEYSDKNSANDRALKGEGIAAFISKKEASRGPQANGGGGGNNHNGGGGGGSNYGTGGAGGQRVKHTTLACGSVVGLNSKPLSSGFAQPKVFMGGGGGAGHGNNAGFDGEKGRNGGGIIILMMDTLIGNGNYIQANGDTSTINSENEGGGGGGAGGSILLMVNQFSGTFRAEANGANGTSVDNFPSTNCSGPGGGGGGGVIFYSNPSVPSGATNITLGGASGKIATSTQSGCSVGNTNGAKSGTVGTTLFSYGFPDRSAMYPASTLTTTGCNSYTSPSGKYTWTSSGTYADTVFNQAGCDSALDIRLTIVPVDTSIAVEGKTLVSNATGVTYQWMDCTSKTLISGANQSQYTATYNGSFAVIVSTGGCSDTSSCANVTGIGIEDYLLKNIRVYPNPTNDYIKVDFPNSLTNVSGKVYSMEGKTVDTFKEANKRSLKFLLNEKGIYILEMTVENQTLRYKVVRN